MQNLQQTGIKQEMPRQPLDKSRRMNIRLRDGVFDYRELCVIFGSIDRHACQEEADFGIRIRSDAELSQFNVDTRPRDGF